MHRRAINAPNLMTTSCKTPSLFLERGSCCRKVWSLGELTASPLSFAASSPAFTGYHSPIHRLSPSFYRFTPLINRLAQVTPSRRRPTHLMFISGQITIIRGFIPTFTGYHSPIHSSSPSFYGFTPLINGLAQITAPPIHLIQRTKKPVSSNRKQTYSYTILLYLLFPFPSQKRQLLFLDKNQNFLST